ncbi:cytochrome oxidase assembly domain protein [Leptospira interrogans str. 2002000624]|nr:cytochrome oxidase assembly domain protein [Leptospira interrogans str. 2002000624]
MNSNSDISSKFSLFYKVSLFLSVLIDLVGRLDFQNGSLSSLLFCLGLILLCLTIWTFADKILRKEFGIYLGIAILLLISQINLGRLTVTLKLDPTSVNLHLLNAIAFFLVILTVSINSREKVLYQSEHFIKTTHLFRKDNILYFILLIGIVIQIGSLLAQWIPVIH